MKIEYAFVNGEHSEVEVSEELGEFILDSRRKEENNDRRYRKYHFPLSLCLFEGKDWGYQDDHSMLFSHIYHILEIALTPIEHRRMMQFIDGFTLTEISKQEGVSVEAVRLSISRSQKKISERLNLPLK